MRLNRAAVRAGVPLIDAAQWGMTGTLVVVDPGRTACLECIYPENPSFEEDFPVVGAISMAVGAMAALEAVKILSRTGDPAFGRLATFDGYQGHFLQMELQRNPNCPCCGAGKVSGV